MQLRREGIIPAIVLDIPQLCVPADALLPLVPRRLALLQAGVVPVPARFNGRFQFVLLGLRGIESIAVGKDHLPAAFLSVDVPAHRCSRDMPRGADIVGAGPEIGKSRVQGGKLPAQDMSRISLQPIHDLVGSQRRREGAKQVNVIGLNCEVEYFTAKFGRLGMQQARQPLGDRPHKNGDPILGYPDEVVIDVVGCLSGSFAVHELSIPRKEAASIPPPPP